MLIRIPLSKMDSRMLWEFGDELCREVRLLARGDLYRLTALEGRGEYLLVMFPAIEARWTVSLASKGS